MINLSNIKSLPTAMFVGSVDDLGDPTDAAWTRDKIMAGGNALKHYEVIPAGHSTFLVGNDMSYFKNVLNLLATYH
jgi:hypothetical protein